MLMLNPDEKSGVVGMFELENIRHWAYQAYNSQLHALFINY